METPPKLTPAEAQARVREGEELRYANCPCCNQLLAIYISPSKPSAAPPTTLSTPPDHL